MPCKGDSPGIDLGALAQKLHGSNDILGFIPIKLALAPPMTAEVEDKGGNTVAGDLLGTGPHGATVRAQTMAQDNSRKGHLAVGQDELPV
jgi:hypothetical protein